MSAKLVESESDDPLRGDPVTMPHSSFAARRRVHAPVPDVIARTLV
jgi:hypothetical protein